MANFANSDQTNFETALFALTLERAGPPMTGQLVAALRDMILSGLAGPGMRLPPSRRWAEELSVSRMTVVMAVEQLVAEGYLAARQGSGTFVAADLPHLRPAGPVADGPDADGARPYPVLTPGVPDTRLFPHGRWAQHLAQAWRQPDAALLERPDPMGWPPLRAAIAAHLRAWRGIACSAGQVAITSGAGEAAEILSLALWAAGAKVVMEDPGYAPIARVLREAGRVPVPVRVDDEGLPPDAAEGAAAVLLTPSRHYPLGVTLPLPRRLALLDWAERTGGTIVEDDYDGEYRYQGQPLPAIMQLDRGAGRVIYLGSFSKLLSPALRLGYMVIPPGLLPQVRARMAATGPRASLVPQPALAGFMQSGDFAIHLRRMRRVYAARQQVLREALDLPPDPGGMHLVLPLPGQDDKALAREAGRAGLGVRALSGYAVLPDPPRGLALGYAAFDEDSLRAGAARLRQVLGSDPSST